MKKALTITITAMILLAARGHAQNTASEAKTAIDAAVAAMGTTALQSIQYTGKGNYYATGQAYEPGGPWPRYTITKYTVLQPR